MPRLAGVERVGLAGELPANGATAEHRSTVRQEVVHNTVKHPKSRDDLTLYVTTSFLF